MFTDQWSFTSPFEGVVPHLYLDSVGYVTCGVGFMLPDEKSCVQLPWNPSISEALADYRLLKEQPQGRAASFYRPLVRARLSEDAMREIFARKLLELHRGLGSWQLARCPQQVQVALLDMAYNLGVSGIERFHNLKAAVLRQDWAAAAEESRRRGVQDARNAATRAAFMGAVG